MNCNNRTISISHETIIGNDNVIFGSSNTIDGNNNVVNGSNCNVTGNNCKVNGSNCRVAGDNCTVRGSSNTVSGDNNSSSGNNNSSSGNNNTYLPAKRGFVFHANQGQFYDADVSANRGASINLSNMIFSNAAVSFGNSASTNVSASSHEAPSSQVRAHTSTAVAPAPAPLRELPRNTVEGTISTSGNALDGKEDVEAVHEIVECCLCTDKQVQLMMPCCKKTSCFGCSRDWFLQQKTCPYCRVELAFVIPIRL